MFIALKHSRHRRFTRSEMFPVICVHCAPLERACGIALQAIDILLLRSQNRYVKSVNAIVGDKHLNIPHRGPEQPFTRRWPRLTPLGTSRLQQEYFEAPLEAVSVRYHGPSPWPNALSRLPFGHDLVFNMIAHLAS
jgi:hypothetical protein